MINLFINLYYIVAPLCFIAMVLFLVYEVSTVVISLTKSLVERVKLSVSLVKNIYIVLTSKRRLSM